MITSEARLPDSTADAPMRVVVVDDEPLAREDLVQMLFGRRGVSVVGSCGTGVQAVEAVNRLQPDLLFLDIRMPALDGFGVVSRIEPTRMPHVVFVTAYDSYAIEAFRVRALDYLLKPVQAVRLDEALTRAREQLKARAAVERAEAINAAVRAERRRTERRMQGADGYWTELMIRTGLRDVVVRVDEIDWIEAETYYARLHVRGRSYLMRERMHVLETRLDPARFKRVHRSAIVNLDKVSEIAHDGRGEHVVVLNSGARVKTSQARWLEFRDIMRSRGRPDQGV